MFVLGLLTGLIISVLIAVLVRTDAVQPAKRLYKQLEASTAKRGAIIESPEEIDETLQGLL